jgi:hypothetical protein
MGLSQMVYLLGGGHAAAAHFGIMPQTTGWPKDKHNLSTAGKVFSCKCWPLGLAHPKTNKPLILIKLKPVDQ